VYWDAVDSDFINAFDHALCRALLSSVIRYVRYCTGEADLVKALCLCICVYWLQAYGSSVRVFLITSRRC
jgi:hypothetical protein